MTAVAWEGWTLPEVGPWDWWPRDHLSASSLSQLERCPEQLRQRYFLDRSEPPSGALVWGKVDGKAHGVNFTQKIDSHEDLSSAEVEEAFAALFDEEVDEQGGESQIDWRDDKPSSIKDRGAALVGTYHRQVSPRVQPTAVEEEFSIDIPGVPIPFIGYIDVSTAGVSIERKTSSAAAKVIPPQYQLQTLGYMLARQRPVEVHISTRTKLPRVVTPLEEPGLMLPHDPSSRAIRIIASRARYLQMLYETYGPDEPWPDAIGTMAWHTAACDLCGFRPDCPWWTT